MTLFCGSADFTFRHLRCWTLLANNIASLPLPGIDLHQCRVGNHSIRRSLYFTSLHNSRLPKSASTDWPPREEWVLQEVLPRQPHRYRHPGQSPGPTPRIHRNRLQKSQDLGSTFANSQTMATRSLSRDPSEHLPEGLATPRKQSSRMARSRMSRANNRLPIRLPSHPWTLCL